MKFNGQEYFKGYVVSQKEITGFSNTESSLIGDYYVYYSQQLEFFQFEKEEKSIIILGYLFDTHHIEHSKAQIAELMINKWEDKALFHDYINKINGRYVLIIRENENIIIYPDATTMRPVFYHESISLIGSHSHLVNEISNHVYQFNNEKRKYYVNGFLDYSLYENIYKLNPNNFRNLTNLSNKRFYPVNHYKVRSVSQLLNESVPIIEQQKNWLKKQNNIFMTLTGGIDSRVSLAFMHSDKLPLLTYISKNKTMTKYAKETYAKDFQIVKMMVEDLKINHEFEDIYSDKVPMDYQKNLKGQIESNHSLGLSYLYTQKDKYKNALHIKSTVYELGKLPFAKHYYEKNDLKTYLISMNNNIPKVHKNNTGFKEKALEGYLRRIDLNSENSKGHYVLDLFYQEQRMGNWHSNITAETDNMMEVFVFMNTREMIEIITSQTLKDREEVKLFREWIDYYWKVLNFYPINKNDDLYQLYKNTIKEHSKLESLSNISILPNEHIIKKGNTFMPNGPIRKKTDYHINIINTSETEKKFLIKSTYNNPAGKGRVFLELEGRKIDMLDINKGVILTVGKQNHSKIKITYTKNYEQPSWQKAGMISLEVEGD